MKQTSVDPEYVEVMPEVLEEGRLYISKRFRTASHLCACGCRSRVVTPLKPAKWQLSDRGGLVSLSPSIGRWQLPCKSHYEIRDNRVVWSRAFTEDEMKRVLEEDAKAVRQYYSSRRKSRSLLAFVRSIWARWSNGDRR